MASDPLQKALDACGGKQTKLAAAVGVSQQAVSKWAKRGRVSRWFVLQVEEATGVPRHELRPDLFPRHDDIAEPATAVAA